MSGPFANGQQTAPPVNLTEKLKEIDRLKQQLQELEQSVRNAIQEQAKSGAAVVPPAEAPSVTAKPEAAPSDASAMSKEADAGFVKWNELVMGKSRLKFYGFLRLDAIYDDSRPSHTQIPAFIRSEDPTAPANISSRENTDDLTIHPRLTRFGIDFTGPEVEQLWGAKTTGKLEVDFYNMPSSESRNAPRMRHAYLKLGWNDFSLLAGQTSDVISPIFPIVNPDFVMWGAGNLGDRRPQLRAEYTPQIGIGKLTLQVEAGLTSADDAQDLDPAASGGFRDGETSGQPTLQARLAYAFPLWQNQKVELGVWGHHARERTDTPIGLSGRRRFDSEAVGLDLTVPLYKDRVWLRGEVWTGEALDDVRGGILQGINLTTGEEVHAKGGWVELGYRPCKFVSLHAGYSVDDPRDSDLPQSGATVGRDQNRILYTALRGYFDPIEIGLDYLRWRTDYSGGFGVGDDNRVQGFISYKF